MAAWSAVGRQLPARLDGQRLLSVLVRGEGREGGRVSPAGSGGVSYYSGMKEESSQNVTAELGGTPSLGWPPQRDKRLLG